MTEIRTRRRPRPALRRTGPAPRAVPAADLALSRGRVDLRAGCPATRLPGPHGPVSAGPARQRLRDRLTRRGVGPAVAILAAVLNADAVSAVVSESWKHVTVQAAIRYAASGPSAAIVSAAVAALAEGASRAMMFHRLMKWAAFLVLIGVATGGAGLAMLAASAPADDKRPAPAGPEANRYRVTMAAGWPRSRWSPSPRCLPARIRGGGPMAPGLPSRPSTRSSPSTGCARGGGRPRDPGTRVRIEDGGTCSGGTPPPPLSYWGGRPTKNGQDVRGSLHYYEASFPRDRVDCEARGEGRRRGLEDRSDERRQRGQRHGCERPQVQLRQARPIRRTADR